MLNNVVLAAAAAVAMLSFANEARADYRESTAYTAYGLCLETGAQGVGGTATVAYWDTGSPVRAGDAIYVRATVINGCNDSLMTVAFRLPFNSFLVEDPNNPVKCFKTSNGGRSQIVDPNQCFLLPIPNDLGAQFAQVPLNKFEALEVYVPVRFAQTFTGTIGVGARNNTRDMLPSMPFAVVPRTVQFFNTTAVPDTTGFNATASLDLRSFYQGGTLFIDYGETTSFGQSIAQTVDAGIAEQSSKTILLLNLTPARTYYYRPRMVTAAGETYVGPTQQFTTPPASIVWPPPTMCRRFPCVR